jgi:hypothetical protein
LSDGGAAAVDCSAGADLDALTVVFLEAEEVAGTLVDSGVSPWGIDIRGSVVIGTVGNGDCVRVPADGVGRDSTGSVIVTSP